MKLTKRAMIIPVASLLLMSGCATHQRSEYAAFAEAGSGYANAVTKVLDAAGKARVDSSSWIFVRYKESIGVSEKSYDSLTAEDAKYLLTIRRLEDHAALLSKYFGKLNSLATSAAPEKTAASVEGVVKGIRDVSSELKTSYPDAFNALPKLAEIAVEMRGRAALREELQKRKDVIRRELDVQKVLLERLGNDINDHLDKAKGVQSALLLKGPITSKEPLERPEDWVKKRHEVVFLPEMVQEIKTASDAADSMKQTFEELLSGKDATGRINTLVRDVEGIIAVVNALNS